jgi:hypothetical protein
LTVVPFAGMEPVVDDVTYTLMAPQPEPVIENPPWIRAKTVPESVRFERAELVACVAVIDVEHVPVP